jgi:hypothetical protein
MTKTKQSDNHKKLRRAIQLPDDWASVADELAAEGPTPLTWFLCELIAERAKRKGKTALPPLPWEG